VLTNKYFREKIDLLFKGNADTISLQLFRYIFVGGSAFIVDFGTLFLLTGFFHFYYLFSASIAFVFGLVLNYFLSVKWIFNYRAFGNRILEFFLFSVVGLLGLGLNELFLWIFTDVYGNHYLFSKIITAIIIFLWNFFVRKLLLFNEQNFPQWVRQL
jgi:putative flippase GtrA